MRMTVRKRAILFAAAAITMVLTACSPRRSAGPAVSERGPDWIADRKIVLQAYIDDIGDTLPNDQSRSPAFLELKRRTGIDLEVRYTPGENDQTVMAAQLASGTIPDVIVSYLNNSTRPEFPILLKAAKDGMFADLSPYFARAKAYNRYLEEGFLPNDTKKNIMWRDDLGGKVYLVHLAIRAVADYLEFDPNKDLVGGPYIQERIVQALNVDITQIRSPEDFYNLLVRIKNAGFKDDNGRPVTPLGPKYWGGSYDAINMSMKGLYWGISDDYNITDEGKVLHEVETDWALRRVNYMRRLLAEGLMDQEFFTMDTTRALEYYTNNSGAIMADAHNYVDLINYTGGWIPLVYLDDWRGSNVRVSNGKGGYSAWAVNADAKNPEEIFRFLDYLSTYDGQLLSVYGLEGVTFDRVNGQPRANAEVQGYLSTGDSNSLINKYGFGFAGLGNYFMEAMLTNTNNLGNFGEDRPGMEGNNPYVNAMRIARTYPLTFRLVEGLNATAYLSHENMAAIKARLDLLNYRDVVQQAVYASSNAEAMRILDSFKQQLINAGVKDFEAYVENIYRQDPKSVNFW